MLILIHPVGLTWVIATLTIGSLTKKHYDNWYKR